MESNKQLEINRLRAGVSSLSLELTQLATQLQDLKTNARNKILELNNKVGAASTKVNTYQGLADVRGRRMPKWYELDIPFAYGDTQPRTATVEISNNPFICTQIQPCYLITDPDPTHFPFVSSSPAPADPYLNGQFSQSNAVGRAYPCTSYFALMYREAYNEYDVGFGPARVYEYIADIYSSYEKATVPKPSLFRGYGWNYPEFDFEIQIQGSGRYWTSGQVPAAAFYGGANPLYLGYEGFVDTSDRLVVTAHPTTPTINTAGIVRFVFFGYEIETSETLSDIFGY